MWDMLLPLRIPVETLFGGAGRTAGALAVAECGNCTLQRDRFVRAVSVVTCAGVSAGEGPRGRAASLLSKAGQRTRVSALAWACLCIRDLSSFIFVCGTIIKLAEVIQRLHAQIEMPSCLRLICNTAR
jgi:hypothetical protein